MQEMEVHRKEADDLELVVQDLDRQVKQLLKDPKTSIRQQMFPQFYPTLPKYVLLFIYWNLSQFKSIYNLVKFENNPLFTTIWVGEHDAYFWYISDNLLTYTWYTTIYYISKGVLPTWKWFSIFQRSSGYQFNNLLQKYITFF